MKRWIRLALMMGAMALAACGVPREAGRVAAANATALAQVAADDDAAVQQALAEQGDHWTHLAAQLFDRELGGISGVDPQFIDLVIQIAALARRQQDLIEQHLDNPLDNRAALEKLRDLAGSADRYLNP